MDRPTTSPEESLRREGEADLAVIIVSTNEAHWLERCLSTVFEHAGEGKIEVIVVDNSSTDGTPELVKSQFPQARVVTSSNRGFAHGNNRGLERSRARYDVLLNPDTEILEGTFAELVRSLDRRPEVGLVGVRQLTTEGALSPTIFRFPSVTRAVGEAFFSERWPFHPAWAGERVLDPDAYDRDELCDWVLGSFMLVRHEALLSAGLLDERLFLYCEEPDLCMRIAAAGWQVRHVPAMTIVHHSHEWGRRPRMLAQDAFARRQYAMKHFTPLRRRLYLAALALRHLVRLLIPPGLGSDAPSRRRGSLRALRTLLVGAPPPFGDPPPTAMATHAKRRPEPPG